MVAMGNQGPYVSLHNPYVVPPIQILIDSWSIM